MSQSKIVQLVALLAMVVFIAASSTLTSEINLGRSSLNMIGSENLYENAPPEFAFAIQAFGAFRGLLTDIAFIRAETFKEQGRYYDAMQLHRWICQLQPRFPTVWEYASWNMAWNISVTTHTAEERWNWVYSGVKLIRDDGLRYNPRAVNLYKQLSWIYVNKMSDALDDFHMAYKRNWAWRMHLLLGPPPDPLGEYRPDEPFEAVGIDIGAGVIGESARRSRGTPAEEERLAAAGETPDKPDDLGADNDASLAAGRLDALTIVRKAAYDRIEAINQAAHTLDELYEKFPETRELVRRLHESELGVQITDNKLTEDDYYRDEGLAFTFFQRYRALADPPSMLARVWITPADAPDTAERELFDQIVGVTEQRPAGRELLHFLQRKILTEVYKLDPAHMLMLIETFGPMDWRSVDAHSLYWVTQSIIKGEETISTFSNDKTNTTRIIFFSLRNLYLFNKITFEPFEREINLSYFNRGTDLNFVEPMHQAFLKYGPAIDPRPGVEGGAGSTYRTAHVNFLSEAIRPLWFSGRRIEAARYYDYLRKTYGRHGDGRLREEYALPLAQFVLKGHFENAETIREATNQISSYLDLAFEELGNADRAQYVHWMSAAMQVHRKFQSLQTTEISPRLKLPTFWQMQIDRLIQWLGQPAPSALITLQKAQLWQYLPVVLKQAVYDDLITGLTAECNAARFNAAKAFPEPPGMPEYRKTHKRRGPEEKDKRTLTPVQPSGG